MMRLSELAASLMSCRKRSVAGSMDLAKATLLRISVGAGWWVVPLRSPPAGGHSAGNKSPSRHTAVKLSMGACAGCGSCSG